MEKEDAIHIVDELLIDMTDRSGLGDEWDMMDDESRKELHDRWVEILVDGV